MIYLRLKDLESECIMDSFPSDFLNIQNETYKDKNNRYIRKNFENGVIEILVRDDERISNSNKVFNSFVAATETVANGMTEKNTEKAREMVDDYLHNITKIHGNQKSIVERCIEGADNLESYEEFIDAVKVKITNNPGIFAEDICALSKEIRLIDFHIGGYNLLQDTSSRVSVSDNHELKKFLLGLSHLFFDSLKKSDVVLSLHNVSDDFLCSIEYETFNIAMHCFVENIVKYAKPYSPVYARTNENRELIFQMDSIRIEKDEIQSIFERGVSGRWVPEDLRGSGIGMYLIKKALDRNRITLTIQPDLSHSSEINGVKYTKNTFVFRFS